MLQLFPEKEKNMKSRVKKKKKKKISLYEFELAVLKKAWQYSPKAFFDIPIASKSP